MFFISLGKIDKNLLLVVLIIITNLIMLIIDNNMPEEYLNDLLLSLEEEIASILLSIILYYIFKNKNKNKQNNNINIKAKKHFKYIIIFFILRSIKSCYEKIYPYFVEDKSYRYGAILNAVNGVEIILMSIITYLLLKYKYYIHHMISMSIYCALGIGIDFILENFTTLKYNLFFIYIIYIINEVLLYCYMKYMMDKLYYQYVEVIFYYGLFGLIIKIIIFTGLSIYEYKNEIDGYMYELNIYFKEANVFAIIFVQFIYYLFVDAIYILLTVLLLYYLRPNHNIICDEFNVYTNLLMYKEKPNKWYTIIPFFFQILALLIYFEIIELNFLGLNKNTIKNIQIREGEEDESRGTIQSTIELGNQYYLKDDEQKNIDRNTTLLSSFRETFTDHTNSISEQKPSDEKDLEISIKT